MRPLEIVGPVNVTRNRYSSLHHWMDSRDIMRARQRG